MRIGGLASGMDTDQIVSDLMKVKKMPLDKLTQKKVWTEWQRDSYRDVNLSMTNLRSSAQSLRFQSTFNAYTATSSNTSSLTASATANAVTGTYTAEVLSIASSAKIHSANTILKTDGLAAKSADVIAATGTITVKDKNGTIIADSVKVTSGMTYKDVASLLQSSTAGKSTEIRASFDDTTSRFFMSTKGLGDGQNFSLEFSSPELANQIINNNNQQTFSTTNAATEPYMKNATNGKVNFEGIVVEGLTSNKTTINGLTLNLSQLGTSTISVQSDSTKTFESIKSMVEKYNETIADLEKKIIEKRYPDFQPLTEEQKDALSDKEVERWEEKSKSGLLRNDPILKSALQDLRRAFMDPVEGIANGNLNLLSQIGISTGSYKDGGKLTINEDKLKEVLTNKPDEVMQLFTNKVGGQGIGERVYQGLNHVVKRLSDHAGNPNFLVDSSAISKRINQMNQDIMKWQDRLVMVEDRYWKQFTAMEKALSQMNSQSTWMQQNMFGGM